MYSWKQNVNVLLILVLAGAATAVGQSCPGGLVADPTGQLSPSAAGGRFGIAVAVDGLTAVVGDRNYSAEAGAAYVYTLTDPLWNQQARLVASDAAMGDHLGLAVAISGDTLVAGSSGHDDVASGSGSVYVFVRSGSSWTQQAKLNASDPANSDYFGQSVAIDGDTIAVGAPYKDRSSNADEGVVYVFVRAGGTWTQQARLAAPDTSVQYYFGRSVALSGATLLVGATGGNSNRGAAYAYVRTDGTWAWHSTLTATDAASGDEFGFAVALDGDTAVIGARAADLTGAADAGSAYVFLCSGGTWSSQGKLTASDAATGDRFGAAVALEGDTALIGADLDDHAGGSDAGAAYIFTRSAGVWSEQIKLGPAQATGGNHFGVAVALRDEVAVVGAEYASTGLAFAYDVHCVDTDGDGLPDNVDNCPINANPSQADLDLDGFGDACDPDIDGDGVPNGVDNCPALVNPDQADLDADNIGNACDPDIDNDTVPNAEDWAPADRYSCRDADADGCDDCSSGIDDPANDELDTDGDGICNLGDPDDDNDGVADGDDPFPKNAFACGDRDGDGCDDCNTGHFDPLNDGIDTDADGICDFGDTDDDGDGAPDDFDEYPTDPSRCGDSDEDGCDDCSSGTFNALNDGPDFDNDGLCDAGDLDDDNDGLPDPDELTAGTDPFDSDSDDDGLLDGAEVDIATDPLNPDTDGDGLLDGSEVTAGTNPLNADTDDDGINDREDPWPLEPGVPPAYLVTECRETAAAIRAMDLSKFVGPTTNARKARRTALACGVTSAANCIASHRYFMAAVELECVDLLIDGCSWPQDWMPPSAEKTWLKDVVELELELTMYLFD